MTTQGICQLEGHSMESEQEVRAMYERQLDILSKYNDLTGDHLEPLNFSGLPPKTAAHAHS